MVKYCFTLEDSLRQSFLHHFILAVKLPRKSFRGFANTGDDHLQRILIHISLIILMQVSCMLFYRKISI